MILKYLFYAFLFYLLFRFIFNFVLPVYRATRQVKRGFREMQEKMREQQSSGEQSQAQPGQPAGGGSSLGEYIDFEEVK
jgi:hypothetical protein